MANVQPPDFTIDRLLEILAEKPANKLPRDHNHLSPRLLTIDQAAVHLGRTKEAVQHLITLGRLPNVRADRRVFIDRLDLDKWIEDHKQRRRF